MSRWHQLFDIICMGLLIYACVGLSNVYAYEIGEYDCSNMLGDQAKICDIVGIEYDVAISHEYAHTWMILRIAGYDIHWECTTLHVIPFP